jgi:hypothetical protein
MPTSTLSTSTSAGLSAEAGALVDGPSSLGRCCCCRHGRGGAAVVSTTSGAHVAAAVPCRPQTRQQRGRRRGARGAPGPRLPGAREPIAPAAACCPRSPCQQRPRRGQGAGISGARPAGERATLSLWRIGSRSGHTSNPGCSPRAEPALRPSRSCRPGPASCGGVLVSGNRGFARRTRWAGLCALPRRIALLPLPAPRARSAPSVAH